MSFVKELLVVIILGVFPLLIAYYLNGEEYLVEVIKALTANRLILYYTLAATGVFYVVAYIDHRIIIRNLILERLHNLLTDVLYEVACSLVGILRLTAGVLFGITVMWLLAGMPEENSVKALQLFFVGVVGFFEAYIIDRSLDNVRKKWMNA